MRNGWLVLFPMTMLFSLAQADTTAYAQSPPRPVRSSPEHAAVLTNQEAWTIYQKYADGWSAISDAQRIKLAHEVIAENAHYSTPGHESGGLQTIIDDMAGFQKKNPGWRFDVGDVSVHHDVALMTWVLVQADGKVVYRGHDQIRVSPDKKIVDLITFAPSVAKP